MCVCVRKCDRTRSALALRITLNWTFLAMAAGSWWWRLNSKLSHGTFSFRSRRRRAAGGRLTLVRFVLAYTGKPSPVRNSRTPHLDCVYFFMQITRAIKVIVCVCACSIIHTPLQSVCNITAGRSACAHFTNMHMDERI